MTSITITSPPDLVSPRSIPSAPRSQCAGPFVKWAGGKTQLIDEISKRLPNGLLQGRLTKYAEPFVGGGAVLFNLIQRFSFERIFVSDANPDLSLAYQVIVRDVQCLIDDLHSLEMTYSNLEHSLLYDGERKSNEAV